MKLKMLLGLCLLGSSFGGFAQNTKAEPIFGTVIERKVQKDSTKKKNAFNFLKPAFLRVGIMGGALINFENSKVGGTSGLRVEYGISNRWSVVAETQENYYSGNAFPPNQASLGINWMPFKSKRLQPYFGVGAGIGGDRFGIRDRSYINNNFGRFNQSSGDGHENIQGFGIGRIGLNYVLFNRIIATVETGYQFNGSTNGGLLRVGASYQFGRKKSKI